MIFSIAASVALAAAPAPPAPIDVSIIQEANHAIDHGRLEEAKLMIGRAVASGMSGPPVERLIANLALASGNYEQALNTYRKLVDSGAKQPDDCIKGAIAALKMGRVDAAAPLTECAVSAAEGSWQAWNARGVLADFQHDWSAADQAYARARSLAPREAAIVNNQGWSELLRGDWAAAVPILEQAATLDGASQRTANNLQLARTALAAELPRRQAGESNGAWAARLNDAGVAAELLGDRKRAIAAFSQAIEASPTWYDRASNNLKAASQN